MKKLAYIPSKQDKKELEELMREEVTYGMDAKRESGKERKQKKALNAQELSVLLTRLTNNTKKQYDIQQQTTHILAVNQELQRKRQEGDKVQNRLRAQGKERDQKVTDLAEQLQKQKKEKYFREIPEISEKGRLINQKTIDRRLDDLVTERQHKKEKLIEKYLPTFHPVVDPHSEFINDVENWGDLQNRMTAKQRQASKRKQIFTKQILQDEKQIFTFKPKINQKSRNIAETLPQREIPDTPFQSSSRSPNAESEVFPFAPTINKNTEALLANRDQQGNCFQRLYNHAKEITIKNETKSNQQSRALSFQPSLNNKSMKIINEKLKKERAQSKDPLSKGETRKEEEFIEEIRIGSDIDMFRARTYSVKESTVTKRDREMDDFNHCVGREHRRIDKFRASLMR